MKQSKGIGFDLFDLPGGLDHPALQLYESLTPRKEGCKLEGFEPQAEVRGSAEEGFADDNE